MVPMFYSYRRRLLPLSLGIALSSWSAAGLAAPEPAALSEDSSGSLSEVLFGADVAQAELDSPGDADLPAAPEGEVLMPEADASGLEPGEAAVPLSVDGRETGTGPSTRAGGAALPQSDRPTEEGFETPPDYLTPDPNPLLVPTQPEEVEIIGTQPLSLETAINLAFTNSEQLRIAELQLERSQAGLRAEQALLYPTADLSATVENTNETNFGVGLSDNATRFNTGVRADYDLGISGERSARIQTSERQVRLSELQVDQTREELKLATTTDYYAVQEALEQIRINEAFLAAAERNLSDTRLREEVGVGTRFDVLQAEVQVANARQTLTQAISQRQITQRQLARRLNIQPSIDLTTLAVNIAGAWPLSLEESIVLAYQNRAELEQFLVERELNESQRQVSLSALRPNLGLFGQFNAQGFLTTPGGVSTSINDGFSVGAQLNWRLFDGGSARARAAQSGVDIQVDETEFENARNNIRIEVEEAYYTLVANQANIDTASVAVNQAEEALELANLRFNAGVGTQLEVINAIRDLTEAEGNLVTAVLNYNRALARLERSISNLESPVAL